MTCPKCGKPMTTQERAAYRVQCENCWVNSLPCHDTYQQPMTGPRSVLLPAEREGAAALALPERPWEELI